jgi:hypothetical protein
MNPPEIEIGSVLKDSAFHKADNIFSGGRKGLRHVGTEYVSPRGTNLRSSFPKPGTHKSRSSTRGDPIV